MLERCHRAPRVSQLPTPRGALFEQIPLRNVCTVIVERADRLARDLMGVKPQQALALLPVGRTLGASACGRRGIPRGPAAFDRAAFAWPRSQAAGQDADRAGERRGLLFAIDHHGDDAPAREFNCRGQSRGSRSDDHDSHRGLLCHGKSVRKKNGQVSPLRSSFATRCLMVTGHLRGWIPDCRTVYGRVWPQTAMEQWFTSINFGSGAEVELMTLIAGVIAAGVIHLTFVDALRLRNSAPLPN